MGKRKRGKSAKKARAGSIGNSDELFKKLPHTFVINRGNVGKNVLQLISDIRDVMEPFTASQLKTRKTNIFRDFVANASVLNVTHILVFTKSEEFVNFRIVRLPDGPTVTFRVRSYCLRRDVLSSLKRYTMEPKQFQQQPLLVLNNFRTDSMEQKLTSNMIQNMFPSIQVDKIDVDTIKRCVLFNRDPETGLIDVRHYSIRLAPAGLSRPVRKLLKPSLPDLGRFQDISQFLSSQNLSDSEAEPDTVDNQVNTLGSKDSGKPSPSVIRLTEIGPRMRLELVKIEEGLMRGQVLYHALEQKTPEQVAENRERVLRRRRVKAKRRQQQEENVRRKRQAQSGVTDDGEAGPEQSDEDEDAEYYRREVGDEPDEDLFPAKRQKLQSVPGTSVPVSGRSKTVRNSPVAGASGGRTSAARKQSLRVANHSSRSRPMGQALDKKDESTKLSKRDKKGRLTPMQRYEQLVRRKKALKLQKRRSKMKR